MKRGFLNLVALKDQVYEHLRREMKKGRLRPGSAINMDQTSDKLGVSKTPLRDALIRLEAEGFVTILPRKGVVVNSLTLEDVRDYYQVIGALESTALLSASARLDAAASDKMLRLNADMRRALAADDFDLYYDKNLQFHSVFIDLAHNRVIQRTVETLKKRLYDFPRPRDFIKEWEERSVREHRDLVALIVDKRFDEAASHLRDVHWSFEVQQPFIRQYYRPLDPAGPGSQR